MTRSLAGELELGRPACVKSAPVLFISRSLAVADTFGLPSLIRCLEIEHVDPPSERSTDAMLEERCLILSASFSLTIVTSIYRE